MCGFEAFINGKHVIGKVLCIQNLSNAFNSNLSAWFLIRFFFLQQVKEKEQARKEYRQAIEKGHGAYLMDQDAPVSSVINSIYRLCIVGINL